MPEVGRIGEPATAYPDLTKPDFGHRQGNQGDLIASQLHGRYYEAALRGRVFTAHAIVTTGVIFSTATGTGGPLLWNGSSTVKAVILAVGWGVTVVTAVAAAIGITGNMGQAAAPSTATAIDSVKNCYIGGALPACTAFRIGTVTNAGGFFHPVGAAHTGALTTQTGHMNWVDVGGMFVVPPFGWVSLSPSATATSLVMHGAIMWEEVPV